MKLNKKRFSNLIKKLRLKNVRYKCYNDRQRREEGWLGRIRGWRYIRGKVEFCIREGGVIWEGRFNYIREKV